MVGKLALIWIPRNELRYQRSLITSIYPPLLKGVIDLLTRKLSYVVRVTWL